jgi:hypothetical protein
MIPVATNWLEEQKTLLLTYCSKGRAGVAKSEIKIEFWQHINQARNENSNARTS